MIVTCRAVVFFVDVTHDAGPGLGRACVKVRPTLAAVESADVQPIAVAVLVSVEGDLAVVGRCPGGAAVG